MKKLCMILPLVILLLCHSVNSQVKEKDTSSENLEKEFKATMESYLKAWNKRDLDTINEMYGDTIGFGYRNPAPRIYNKEFMQAANKWVLDSYEIFETIPKDDYIVRVVGNVGLVLGTFIEKFKPKEGELESIEFRFSMTFIRVEGKWQMVLYHRDIQFAK
jgi:ketosteroid isomerase-like protein